MGFMTLGVYPPSRPWGCPKPTWGGFVKAPFEHPKVTVGLGAGGDTPTQFHPLGTRPGALTQLCRRDPGCQTALPGVEHPPGAAQSPSIPLAAPEIWNKVCFGCALSSFSGGAAKTTQELPCNLME